MNISKNVEKKVSQKRFFKLYIVPFISILVFSMVILFLVFPKISELFDNLDKISSLSDEYNLNQSELISLQNLANNTNFLAAQLNVIDNTAPTGNTEVVAFRDKLTSLCQQNNLTVIAQRLSEADINTDANNINKTGLSLLEIPFNFEIYGDYSNILKFISDLSSIEDFVIVREMSLSSSIVNNSQSTTLKLRVDKYQFNILKQDTLDAQYLAVPSNAQISDVVLQYIQSKISTSVN